MTFDHLEVSLAIFLVYIGVLLAAAFLPIIGQLLALPFVAVLHTVSYLHLSGEFTTYEENSSDF